MGLILSFGLTEAHAKIVYLDTIRTVREALIERLITPVHRDLDARMKAEPHCKVGSSGYPKMLCDAATIGSLHRHMLKTRGCLLPRSASEIEDSVVELGDWLFSMMAKVLTPHRSNPSDTGNLDAQGFECVPAPRYAQLRRQLHADIPAIVASYITPVHRKYMAAQRAKTGLVLFGGTHINQRSYFRRI